MNKLFIRPLIVLSIAFSFFSSGVNAKFLTSGDGSSLPQISGSQIKQNTIDSSRIQDGAINNSKIVNGSIDSSKIVNGAIDGTKINSNTILNVKSITANGDITSSGNVTATGNVSGNDITALGKLKGQIDGQTGGTTGTLGCVTSVSTSFSYKANSVGSTSVEVSSRFYPTLSCWGNDYFEPIYVSFNSNSLCKGTYTMMQTFYGYLSTDKTWGCPGDNCTASIKNAQGQVVNGYTGPPTGMSIDIPYSTTFTTSSNNADISSFLAPATFNATNGTFYITGCKIEIKPYR